MTRLPILLAFSLFGLTACGLMPDHSLDYRQAPDLPALKLLEGKAMRTPRPLYAIPEIAAARNTVVLTERDGKHEKFLIPAPEPLVTAQPGKVADNGKAGPVAGSVSPPRWVTDGNGYPLLQVDGDPEQVWDALGRALEAAKFQVEDRNQSLGVYYLKQQVAGSVPEMQLKVTRTPGTSILSLQLNEDTVADTAVARQLFAKLLESWPG